MPVDSPPATTRIAQSQVTVVTKMLLPGANPNKCGGKTKIHPAILKPLSITRDVHLCGPFPAHMSQGRLPLGRKAPGLVGIYGGAPNQV